MLQSKISFPKRILSVVLTLILLITVLPGNMLSASGSEQGHVLEGGNEWLKVYADSGDGSFAVLPAQTDFDKNLLRSHAAVLIGGREYTYGENDAKAGTSFTSAVDDDGTLVTQWMIFDYVIKQNITVIQDESNVGAWAAQVWYDILYLGQEASDISLRLLLDTRFGENDDAAVIVDGEPVMNETSFTPAPEYFYVSETADGPKAYGYLSNGNADLTEPSSLDLIRYPKGSLFSVSTEENKNIAPDSAALLTFPNTAFPPYSGDPDTDAAERRVIYSAAYGYYDLNNEGAEDALQPLQNSDLSMMSTMYKLTDRRPDLNVFTITVNGEEQDYDWAYTGDVYDGDFHDEFFEYSPLYAAEGDKIVLTRMAPPEEFTYSDAESPDGTPRILVYDEDGNSSPLNAASLQNPDGTKSFSFDMPAGKVEFEQEINQNFDGGWRQIRFERMEKYNNLLFQTGLAHGYVKLGGAVNVMASSGSNKKIWMDVRWSAGSPNTGDYVPFAINAPADSSIWSEFSASYTANLPNDDFYSIAVTASQQNMLFASELQDILALTSLPFRHCDGQVWIAADDDLLKDSVRLDLMVSGSNSVNKPSAYADFYRDYGDWSLAVYDGYGNELPYWINIADVYFDPDTLQSTYYDNFSSAKKYAVNTNILWAPEKTPAEIRNAKDKDGNPFFDATETADRILLRDVTSSWWSIPESPMGINLLLPENYGGEKLSNVTVKLIPPAEIVNPPVYYPIHVWGLFTEKNGSAVTAFLSSDMYTLSAARAASGEKFTLTLFDTDEYSSKGIDVSSYPLLNAVEKEPGRIYEFTVPDFSGVLDPDITVRLDYVKNPESPVYQIVQKGTFSQIGKPAWSFAVTDESGKPLQTARAGDRIYLSEPQFVSGCGDTIGNWTLLPETFEILLLKNTTDDTPEYIQAQKEAGTGRYYFVMPNERVRVGIAASAEYDYQLVRVQESADEEGHLPNDYILSPFSLVYANGHSASGSMACRGDEVRVFLPKDKKFTVDDANGGTTSYTFWPYMYGINENGTFGLKKVEDPNDLWSSGNTFDEYSFTMGPGQAVVYVKWYYNISIPAPVCKVDLSKLPADVPEYKLSHYVIDRGNGSAYLDMNVETYDTDGLFSFEIPGHPDTGRTDEWRTSAQVRLSVDEDTTAYLIYTPKAAFPEITAATQFNKYSYFNNGLVLKGRGLIEAPDDDHLFNFRVTFLYDGAEPDVRMIPNYEASAFSKIFQTKPGTGWQDETEITFIYTRGQKGTVPASCW